MPDLSRQALPRAVIPMLAFAGPADPRSTRFVDTGPDRGVFGTLDGPSAAQASTPPGPGRSTAATHAEHLRDPSHPADHPGALRQLAAPAEGARA